MKRLIIGAGLCLLAILAIALGLYAWLLADLPDPQEIGRRLAKPSVRIVDRMGRPLYEVIDPEQGRHSTLTLDQIPVALQQATIATEDRDFYRNPGVDVRGVARAFWINLRGGDVLAGGSTITQQVARNLLLDEEERGQRSVRRKLRESWLAWRLTRRFEKEEILALYLNQIYYGAMAYGVEAAAQTYLGKAATELTLAESALLAGLPQAPAVYNPLVNPEAAKERQGDVLELMRRQAFITTEQQTLASREPLQYAATPYPVLAPHFVMMVRAEIDALFTQEEVYQHGGLTVRTTLDLDWQQHAERVVNEQLRKLNAPSGVGQGHDVQNAALVALDPNSGEVRVLVGNRNYFDTQHGGAINMALAPRQPGSAIKPILYAAALSPEREEPWTAASVLFDVRTVFMTHEGKPYVPVNFSRQEHGPVMLRQALASSLNIPTVSLLDSIGVETATSLATGMGISTLGDPDEYDLSFALGSGPVRLLELTAAYGVFANGGSRIEPRIILEVVDGHGRVLHHASPPQPVRVIDERVAWLISDILADNDARRLSFGSNSVLKLDRPAAAKTGTTNNFRDNWTVGYAPELVAGVWVGNADNRPMENVTGISGAGPIWHRFMRTVLNGRPETPFRRPAGLERVEVCSVSPGVPSPLPSQDCPYKRQEWFLTGTEPTEIDTFFRTWQERVPVDLLAGSPASEGIFPLQADQRSALDLPTRPLSSTLHAWAETEGQDLSTPALLANLRLPATTEFEWQGGSEAETQRQTPLRLVSPVPNTVYRISPSIPISAQRLHFEAVASIDLEQVTLWLDDEPLASANTTPVVPLPYEAWWTLQPGRHLAWVEGRDIQGRRVASDRIYFEVRGPDLDDRFATASDGNP